MAGRFSLLKRPVDAPHYRYHSSRYGQRRKFICLQGNLLRKHDVAWDEIPPGGKAQDTSGFSLEIDFVHVRNGPVLHSVPPASRATDDIEVPLFLKLSPLSWR